MPVGSDEQAVTLMNDSRYGLTGSIWTSDAAAAERLSPRIGCSIFGASLRFLTLCRKSTWRPISSASFPGWLRWIPRQRETR